MTSAAPAAPLTVREVFAARKQPLSFEIFPPRGELSHEEARRVSGELAGLGPSFISVTYSAGGSGNGGETTTEVASMIQREHGVPTVAHLTCQGLSRAAFDAKVAVMRAAGIHNVLALRGDPRPDIEPGAFADAVELTAALVEEGFCVGGAAYPEGHISCTDLDADVAWLKAKQDSGASFLVTQLFFDNEDFYRFRERAAKAGVTVPITCGIMPFMSKKQVSRMVFMCGASLPARLVRVIARYEGDDEALRRAGVEYAAEQLADLRDHGADGLHVYTMNRPAVARELAAAARA